MAAEGQPVSESDGRKDISEAQEGVPSQPGMPALHQACNDAAPKQDDHEMHDIIVQHASGQQPVVEEPSDSKLVESVKATEDNVTTSEAANQDQTLTVEQVQNPVDCSMQQLLIQALT